MSVRAEACGGLWRSEDVLRMDAYVARDALRDSILQLGLLGNVQLIDLQGGCPQFSRPHAAEVRQCDETLRKLEAIEAHLVKAPNSCAAFESDVGFCAPLAEVMAEASSAAGVLDEVTDAVESTLADLEALDNSIQGICQEMNAAAELSMLRGSIVSSARRAQRWGLRSNNGVSLDSLSASSRDVNTAGVDVGARGGVGSSAMSIAHRLTSLPHVVGTIAASRADAVSGLAFRTTRGHAVVSVDVVQNEQFVQPDVGALSESAVSLCIFSVFSSSVVAMTRLRKLLVGLGATVYNLEDVLAHEETSEGGVNPDAPDSALRNTLSVFYRQREVRLRQWYPYHRRVKVRVRVEKQLAAALGMCTFSGSMCTCALWVPARHEQDVRAALELAADASGSLARPILAQNSAAHTERPPTYFMTDRFTACFQGIVDSYGPARYKEINPGVFTIITFPYLFGIMYGDIGHGCLLLCLALCLIYKERSWEGVPLNEMLAMLYGGRYTLLLMSLFAIYLGVLYNDFFGFSLNTFASSYDWPAVPNATTRATTGYSDRVTPQHPDGLPSVRPAHPCAFGIDAAWAETDNKLEFYNSVKMKAAVIVGVVHMLSGLLLALLNALRARDYRRVWFQVVPETVFLTATFGYMGWLIVLKWCTRWANTHDAPSILETMTNFFLQPGAVPHPLFAGQAQLQVLLLLMAVAMVPLMLLGIPISEYRAHKRWVSARREHQRIAQPGLGTNVSRASGRTRGESGGSPETQANSGYFVLHEADDAAVPVGTSGDDDDDADGQWRSREHAAADAHTSHFDISEVAIHYTIHTIEYVLSSVSNTASYLRLWALSLAHAQLSEVFFNFAIVAPLSVDSSGVVIGVGVAVWLVATLGVLVGMEALSAFLHALRLHWVEFQSKFYAGDGHMFTPFTFTP